MRHDTLARALVAGRVVLFALGNLRDARNDGLGDLSRSRNPIGVFYTYLGQVGLGAVPRPR